MLEPSDTITQHLSPDAVTLPPDPAPASLALPCRFSDFELLEEIAQGGMGVVYRARQLSLNRVVALKMIRAGRLATALDVARFRAEAQAAGTLDHPNILPIYGVGECDGQHYFTMKLVAGGSLQEISRKDAKTQRREDKEEKEGAAALPSSLASLRLCVRYLAQVARGVHHAHQRGILHRDLKPANILIDADGTPYVADFGLARSLESDSGLTQSGAIVGTPSYMAPEQARAERTLTTAVDVYSLGAMLYELLTGRPPFRAANPLETLRQVLDHEPPAPRTLNPRADRDLATIALKCLEKDPNRRYGSAEALAEELERWLRGEPIQTRAAGRVERVVKWARRKPAIAALVATVLLVAVLGLAGILWQWHEADAARQAAELAEADALAKATAAEQAQASEKVARLLVERHLYGSRMNQAAREILANFTDRAEDLLGTYLDSPLCDWEWHYLKRQCNQHRLSFKGARQPLWAPDGSWVAVVGLDARYGETVVQFHDPATGKVVRRLPQQEKYITNMAISQDGRWLATAADSLAVLHDLTEQRVPRRLQMPKNTTSAWPYPAFSNDGTKLAVVQNDRVRVWDTATGEAAPFEQLHEKEVPLTSYLSAVVFSADGKSLIASCGNGKLHAADPATGAVQFRIDCGGAIEALAIEPKGHYLAAGGSDGAIRICSFPDRKVAYNLAGHRERISTLAFSSDGAHLASGSSDRSVKVWAFRDGRVVQILRGHTESIYGLAFSPDGKTLATAQRYETKLWDAPAPPRSWQQDIPGRALSDLAYSPDGKLLAVARSWSSTFAEQARAEVELWDAQTGKLLRRLARTLHADGNDIFRLRRLAWSPDSSRLAIIDPRWRQQEPPRPAQVWDVGSGAKLFDLEAAGEEVAFSPDGRWLATLTRKGRDEVPTVKLWNTVGKVVAELHPPHWEQVALAWSRDGRLATAIRAFDRERNVIHLWRVTADEQLVWDRDLPDNMDSNQDTSQIAFSPDGRWLVQAGWNGGGFHVWDVKAGKKVASINEHRRRGSSPPIEDFPIGKSRSTFAFHPDGRRLAFATDHGSIHLRDLELGQDVLVIEGLPEGIDRVLFTPDGQRLLALGRRSEPGKFDPWFVWDASALPAERLYERPAELQAKQMYEQLGLKQVILQRAREMPGLGAAFRAILLQRIEAHEENADQLNNLSWEVVSKPGQDAAAYRLALEQARRANELIPNEHNHLNTLGVAEYRTGQYTAALKTLHRGAAEAGKPAIEDLVFLALSYHKLGRDREAVAALAELRRQVTPEMRRGEIQLRALIEEAENEIAGKER